MNLLLAGLFALISIQAHAGAGAVLFNGSSPASDASQNTTPLTVTTSTGIFRLSSANNSSAFPYSPLMVFGNANTYLQAVLQNLSNGTNASGDLVITNDLGGDTSFYLNAGINSSRFSQALQSAQASSSSYITSSDSDLLLWSDTNGGLNRPSGAAIGHVIIGSSNPVSGNTGMDVSSAIVVVPASSGLNVTNGLTAGSITTTGVTKVGDTSITGQATVSSTFSVLGIGLKLGVAGSVTQTITAGGTNGRLCLNGDAAGTGASFCLDGPGLSTIGNQFQIVAASVTFNNTSSQNIMNIIATPLPTGGALCVNALHNLSKCTSVVDVSGNCTCP